MFLNKNLFMTYSLSTYVQKPSITIQENLPSFLSLAIWYKLIIGDMIKIRSEYAVQHLDEQVGPLLQANRAASCISFGKNIHAKSVHL